MTRTITEALRWPLLATCGVCGGSLEIYPYPAPAGSKYCQNCSPTWLRSFLEFATKDTASRGWKPRAAGSLALSVTNE